jgi:16S rRNA (uracil1498-N3)-methyltransferase
MDGDQLAVEPTGPIQAQVAKPPLHLVLAVTKRNALDRSVRMATELGATQIHLFLADRSVAKASNADRLTRLVEAAMQQCGRADRPLVEAPVDLGTALSRAPCLPIFAARPEAEPSDIEAVHGARLVIGPEGGLSCREVATLETLGATPISLGEWTLRADTAVAAGLALLSAKITKSKK